MCPAAIVSLALLAATGPAAPPVPVLVELFTSEGCSSCPPADALLERLVSEQPVPQVRIVALGEHVDYWNDLGWRDRFSDPAFTNRQVGYVRRLGRSSPYTPQVVVDGERDALGSSRAAVMAAIAAQAPRPKGEVRVRREPSGTLRVEASWPGGAAAGVFLAVTERRAATDVTRGENAGRRLLHASVARSLVRIGTGSGVFLGSAAVPEAPLPGTSWVVFVQATGGGRVLAVGETSAAAPAPGG
jgi:hypothetical protein